MLIDFNWLTEKGIVNVLKLIYNVVDIIRYIVPIILIIMTTVDIFKKVINPNEKEGQQTILRRIIAAIIVFLIPVFIRLIMSILEIEVNNDDIKNIPIQTDTPITSLKINNCPSSTRVYHNLEKLTLHADTSLGYNDGIIWSVNKGIKYVTLIPSSDKKSVEISFSNIYSNDNVIIKVQAGGMSDTCTINLDSEKLDNLIFMNCPNITKNPGDSFELKTNISSSFNGEVEWKIDNNQDATINVSNNTTDAVINIYDVPASGYINVQVKAGGKSSNCAIKVENKNTPTPIPSSTNIPSSVTCSKGTYLPGQSYNCKICLANYYCPGGVFRLGDFSPNGLVFCGNNYTSQPGSDDFSDCKFNIISTPQIPSTISPTLTPKPILTPKPTVTITPTIKPTPTLTPTPFKKIVPNVVVSPLQIDMETGENKSYQVKVVDQISGTFYNDIIPSSQSNCIRFYQQDFSRTEINGSYRQFNTNYGIPIEGVCESNNIKIMVTFVPNDTSKYEQVINVVNVNVSKSSSTIDLNNKNVYYTCGAKNNSYQRLNSIYYAPKGLTNQGGCYMGCDYLKMHEDYDCVCNTTQDPLGSRIIYQCTGKGKYTGTRQFYCYGTKNDLLNDKVNSSICSNWN